MAKRRVVVTGMGAVTPIGLSVDEFWQSIKAQKTGFSEITKFDTTNYKCKLAAEVKEFDAKNYMDAKEARRMELFSQYAVAAAKEAIEDAGLEMDVGVAVVIRPALPAVARQAGAVAVDGVEGGHGVDHAVVRPPALVDVEAAGGVLVIVFAHVDRAGVEQRPHPGRRDVVAGDRVLHGLVAGVGEVVDVRLDADAVVDLERSVDRQVEKSVVVVRHEVGAEHALQRLEHGLVRILVDAELLELEVIEILDLRDAEALGERLGQICCRVHDRAVGLDEGRAVVGRGDLGHGVHPAALAAGEQRTRRSAGGLGRGNFLGAAVGHQLEELARGRAAEAVADEVDGALRAPAGKERPIIGDAVARVVVRRSVRRAVIDRRAGQLGIELARAVPCAGDRADGGRVRLIAELVRLPVVMPQ